MARKARRLAMSERKERRGGRHKKQVRKKHSKVSKSIED